MGYAVSPPIGLHFGSSYQEKVFWFSIDLVLRNRLKFKFNKIKYPTFVRKLEKVDNDELALLRLEFFTREMVCSYSSPGANPGIR